MCFIKQLMVWEYSEKPNEPKSALLGTVPRRVAYVCPLWASMNCCATVKSSHTLLCRCRSSLQPTKHSCNIPTCAYCCLQRLKKKIISLCFIHTDTLVNISGIETEKILFWKGPLDVIYPDPAQSMHLSWNKHITSSSLDNQHKIFMKNKNLNLAPSNRSSTYCSIFIQENTMILEVQWTGFTLWVAILFCRHFLAGL